MKSQNEKIAESVKKSRAIYSALRRSDFALQIRLAMGEKGVRNVDLATRLGVSEANVCKLLKGSQNLSLDTMYALTDALEESLSIVVGPVLHEQENEKDESFGRESVLGEQGGELPCNVIFLAEMVKKLEKSSCASQGYNNVGTVLRNDSEVNDGQLIAA